jgi:hypothetical protein
VAINKQTNHLMRIPFGGQIAYEYVNEYFRFSLHCEEIVCMVINLHVIHTMLDTASLLPKWNSCKHIDNFLKYLEKTDVLAYHFANESIVHFV